MSGKGDDTPPEGDAAEKEEGKGRFARGRAALARAAQRVDSHPRAVRAAQLLREALPGDSSFGDPLSTAGGEQPHLLGRRLSTLTAERPGMLREWGMGALQVWQALSEAQGRGRGDRERAIVFTDLVEFSDWALEAGDDAALDLLRAVAEAIEPPVTERGGTVVKWLGDGMMAVFDDPQSALDAALEACENVCGLEAKGYEPRMRAGLHVGRPRRLGGDYLGTDVTVAARMTEEARAEEVLVSSRALEAIEAGRLKVRKKRFFRVKGVPEDIAAFSVSSK